MPNVYAPSSGACPSLSPTDIPCTVFNGPNGENNLFISPQVLLTYVAHKRMRTVTNIFLVNLAVVDLLLACVCMPENIIPLLLKHYGAGITLCCIVRYIQGKLHQT